MNVNMTFRKNHASSSLMSHRWGEVRETHIQHILMQINILDNMHVVPLNKPSINQL